MAQLDGAKIVYWKSIESIDDEGPVFRNSILDDEGQVVGLSDETEHVNCDSVIICVSQVPKDKLLLTTKGLAATDRGTLVVDENCMCTVPGVFAAGDVVSGPKTVVHAVVGAKHAVAGMMDYLGLQRADDEVE